MRALLTQSHDGLHPCVAVLSTTHIAQDSSASWKLCSFKPQEAASSMWHDIQLTHITHSHLIAMCFLLLIQTPSRPACERQISLVR